MSRYLDEEFPGLTRSQALARFKASITGDVENRIRAFLSGELRAALLDLLEGVRAGTQHVYAALFELGDEELVAALEALGPRAHVVLANGSIQAGDGESAAQARKRDENAAARARLIATGADVEPANRFVAPKPLAHNKFLVVTDARGRAGAARVDRQHELDHHRPVHAAQQRPPDRRPGGRRRVPGSLARAARRRLRAPA
jgi:hypothetical protein